MEEVQRISIKKIYVGKAALFGLLYGLLLGVIFTFFFLIIFYFGGFTSDDSGFGSLLAMGVLVFAIIMIPFFAICTCIFAILSALIYNLIARMKGDIHLGMMEIGNVNTVTNQI